MIYLQHNLMKNYHSANGMGDSKMRSDILVSEIAKMVVNHPRRVIQNLNRTGFPTSAGVSRGRLVKIVSHALHKSKRFARAIAADIASGNYPFSANGAPAPPKQSVGDVLGNASSLVAGLGALFGGKSAAEKAKAEAEKAKAEAEKALADKAAALAGGKVKVGKYIAIAMAVAGTAAIVIYAFRK